LEIGKLALYGGACAFSFAFFVFFAGRLNPFVKPKRFDPAYRRVTYFRYVAGALLMCALLAVFTFTQLSLSWLTAGCLGSILFVLLIASPTLRYHRLKLRNKSEAQQRDDHLTLSNIQTPRSNIRRSLATNNPSKSIAGDSPTSQSTEDSVTASPMTSPANKVDVDTKHGYASSIVQAAPDLEVPAPVPAAPVPAAPVPMVQTIKNEVLPNLNSTEYELEMALRKSTQHIDDDLADLDQSIVEAEFESILSSETNGNGVAQPDFYRADSEALNNIERELNSRDTNFAEYAFPRETSINTQNQTGNHNDQPQSHEQGHRIAALERENAVLSQEQESLKGEVAKLELSVRQRDAAVRKNIALKEQALAVKSKALTMAAMERKKRKLTEIQAQKIILKLKNNMRQLEHDAEERQV